VDSQGMVSGLETIPSCLLMTSSDPTKEEILARVASLEEKSKSSGRKTKSFEKRTNSYDRKTNGSEPSSGGTKSPIHHRARTNLTTRSRPRPRRTRTTSNHVLTVVRLVESQDMTRSGVTHLTQIKKSRSPVTAIQSVAKRSTSRRASAPDSSRNSRIHNH